MANQQTDQRLAAVIKDASIACDRAGRQDLRARIDRLGSANEQATSSIVVVGEFRVGKGSTINALLGASVCPTAGGIEPHGPIRISYGERPQARVWSPGANVPTSIEPAVVASGAYSDELRIKGLGPIEVEVPLQALRSGLTFVDTPSSGGLSSFKAVADLELVRQADAVLFVTSASQPLTRSEVGALETLSLLCPLVTVVLNKIDYYPAWREIRSIDDHSLRDAGLTARVIPISARLAMAAGKDQELLAESGVPVLAKYVRDQVIEAIGARRRRETAEALGAVLDQIESPMTAELRALEDPESAAETVRSIEHEYEELDRARRSTAGWQTVLADSFDDLVSGAERQLRDDFAAMIRDSEQAINEQDPRVIWSDMQVFAVQRCTWILARTLDTVATTCADINLEVAERFGGTSADVAHIAAPAGSRGADSDQPPTSAMVDVRFDKSSRKDRMFVGFRGVVGGLTMFSVLGSFVFPPLITVAPIGAVVMGRKVVAEDRERMLERSRVAARTAIRRYCDDALRAASADVRQIAKEYRRELRDHYASRADETARTLTRQLDALRETKQRAKAEHAARAAEVRKEVGRIQALRGIVDTLVEPASFPPPTGPARGAG